MSKKNGNPISRLTNLFSETSEEDEIEEVEVSNRTKYIEKKKSVNIKNDSKIVIYSIRNADDGERVVDLIKENRTVFIKYSKLDQEVNIKVHDFLLGAIYALEGTIKKVETNTFVVSSKNVSVEEIVADEE